MAEFSEDCKGCGLLGARVQGGEYERAGGHWHCLCWNRRFGGEFKSAQRNCGAPGRGAAVGERCASMLPVPC
ncbi:Hypothetical predicted protein [Marmota monax]|uniref:Uncharacterized protein n=1 Tax=Marmota monax TaxID=9995 RepID=A0A5E4B704_MARMO|nr:hypothetical protein GHT09_005613 [Marmota monax]VTJ64850.1 Hypothetical predicted protein [Marmota monax]